MRNPQPLVVTRRAEQLLSDDKRLPPGPKRRPGGRPPMCNAADAMADIQLAREYIRLWKEQ